MLAILKRTVRAYGEDNAPLLAAALAFFSVFALLFKLLPNAHVPWRATWIGATVTALLFVVARWLFGIYIANVAVASAYGAAGSLVVLLLWIYVSAHTLIFGAELTQVLAGRLPGVDGITARGT